MSRGPRRVATLLALALASACVQPGPRAVGTGEGRWGGDPPAAWEGACVYDVTTKWAASYNHVIELGATDGDERITLARSRAWREGTWALETAAADREVIGTAWEGNTVVGAIRGELRIREAGDSLFAELVGVRVHRDTVPLTATCRLGPIAG